MGQHYEPQDQAAQVLQNAWREAGWSAEKGRPAGLGGRFRVAMLVSQKQLLELYLPQMDARTRARALNTLDWLRAEIKRARTQMQREKVRRKRRPDNAVAAASAAA